MAAPWHDACVGTMEQYVKVFFGNEFSIDHTPQNAIVIGFVLVLTQFLTWLDWK